MSAERELDETDPTPPEYDRFKQWYYARYPDGPGRGGAPEFQDAYRAYQAGYRQREKELGE